MEQEDTVILPNLSHKRHRSEPNCTALYCIQPYLKKSQSHDFNFMALGTSLCKYNDPGEV